MAYLKINTNAIAEYENTFLYIERNGKPMFKCDEFFN